MKRQRTTRTTLEEHEVMIVKSLRRVVTLPRCPACPQRVALITLPEAVILAGVNSRVIHQWIESGSIHFAEASNGIALVCPVSLAGKTHPRSRVGTDIIGSGRLGVTKLAVLNRLADGAD